jgi:hypothetical protein
MPRKLLTAVFLAGATPLAAQSTGTPVFHAPYRIFERYELGGNLSDAGNIAFEGFYGFSQAGAKWDIALRGGVLDSGDSSSTAVLAGVDLRYRIITQTEDFPLDGALVGGVGSALVSGNSRLYLPIGLSLGRRFDIKNSTVSVVPYVQPLLMPTFGSDLSDVLVALGLGADVRIDKRFELRIAIGIGDVEHFSLGFAITR